ncbi:MAG: IS110 family transposase [Actinobacteria bacterium]|nr:IS110 family transposase [Actinomycetota bacterium]
MNTTHTEKINYVSIDVASKKIDVLINGKVSSFSNTISSVDKMLNKANKYGNNNHFILEATGGYERVTAWRLLALGEKVSIINPARVREYAKSMGQFAKTDKIDTRIIKEFAEAKKPRLSELPSENQRSLTSLTERRRQLKDIRVDENNRLNTTGEKEYCKRIKKHVAWLDKEIKDIESKLKTLIKKDEDMRIKAERMMRIKGIGITTAITILAFIPEIGTLSRQQVAALVGVAPFNHDSATIKKPRHIQGGRKHVRACLYMAALCAITHNAHLKPIYERLINDNNRCRKVALVAIMRRLIIAANSAVKNPDFALAV